MAELIGRTATAMPRTPARRGSTPGYLQSMKRNAVRTSVVTPARVITIKRGVITSAGRGVAPGSAGKARCNATKQKGRSQNRDS